MLPALSHNKTVSNVSEISFSRLIGMLVDHFKLIVGITFTITLLTIVYILFATPVYQADAVIQVEQKEGNAILESLNQMLPDSTPQSAPEISLLQSRMILGKTVSDLNLQAVVKQKYFPIFGRGWARMAGHTAGRLTIARLYLTSEGNSAPEALLHVIDSGHYVITGKNFELKGLVGELEEGSGISIKVDKIDAQPGDEFSVKYISEFDAIDNLQNSYSVSEQGKDSGMLSLVLTGTDSILLKKILVSITSNYLAQNIDRQAAQDAKSLDFLKIQLPKVRSDLDKAEDKLNQYRQQKDTIDLPMEAKTVLDQIVNVDNQLNELTFREAEISQLYTKDHPTYKALLEKKETLKEEKARLNTRVSTMPDTQQQVLRLSRDVESGRTVYMQLLNRQQELDIAKSSAIGNVRIIDIPMTRPKPVKPKKALLVAMAVVFGGLFAVGFVFIRLMLHKGINSSEGLEDYGIRVYANIPVSDWGMKRLRTSLKYNGMKKTNISKTLPGVLALENPADLAIEAIRNLRTSLYFSMAETGNNLLMISGASPGVGKTFISSNLAEVISQIGKKVLLIDADMRRGNLHAVFGQELNLGLSELLDGRAEKHEVIRRVHGSNIDYISRGYVPDNPAELLMNQRLEDLLSWSSQNYDYVIIDTPPILAVTEAAIIGQYVDTTLLVVRFKENTAKQIEVCINRLTQTGVKVTGCILNGLEKRQGNYYEYGYSNYALTYPSQK